MTQPYVNALRVRPVIGIYARSTLARHSLLFMLLLPCFASGEVASVLLMAFFTVWVMLAQWRIKLGFIFLVAPIVLLLLIGLLGARQYPLFDVIKDVWYIGKVVVAIGAGYVLAHYFRGFTEISRIVVLAGAIAAGIHFIEIAIHLRSGISLFTLRDQEGVKGYFITVLGLALISSLPSRALGLAKSTYFLAGLICFGSLLASFSRTYIVMYILIVAVTRGWARISVKNAVRLVFLLLLSGLLIVVLVQSNTSGEKSLAGKFASSGSEVTVQDYDNMRDINLNWRGFESYRALVDFGEGTYFQKIFGQGLGATVDIGFNMNLGGREFRYIPVLHNGYMYLLVKIGIIGLLVYLYFLLKMIISIPYAHSQNSFALDELRARRLIAAIGWCFLLTTFVIAGPFNKITLMSALVLVGLCAGFINQRSK